MNAEQRPEELVPPERREQMLKEMGKLIESFYWQAFKIGCHPFIEFCGLMGEYLKIAEHAHKQGIDFTNATAHSGHPLPIEVFHAAYLGEKLGCIYGPALQRPENRRAFLQALGLEDPHPIDDLATIEAEDHNNWLNSLVTEEVDPSDHLDESAFNTTR